jgi:hypothetical protein
MHSDNSTENYHFSFTCDECTYRGNRTHDSNYVRIKTVDGYGNAYRSWSESDKYPERCKECSRKAKRHTRMVNRLDKVWRISYDVNENQPHNEYARPKLITFALPSIVTFDSSPDAELRKLKDLLPAARQILKNHGVLGGVYVPEVTTRSTEFMGTRCYKHHAHVHMVAIAPFKRRRMLYSFSKCLLPLGLGRINYVAPTGHWKSAKRKVASYISKYLCKEGRRASSFGIYRGYQFQDSDPSPDSSRSDGKSAKT